MLYERIRENAKKSDRETSHGLNYSTKPWQSYKAKHKCSDVVLLNKVCAKIVGNKAVLYKNTQLLEQNHSYRLFHARYEKRGRPHIPEQMSRISTQHM